jgi:hypothetical protein
MLDMEDDKFIALDGKENGISESAEVPATDARILRLLNQIRIIEKLRDGVVDAVGEIGNDRWRDVEKIRDDCFELFRGRFGIAEPSWARRARLLEDRRYAFVARKPAFAHGLEAALHALALGMAHPIEAGAARLDLARIVRQFLLILLRPGGDLFEQRFDRG